MHGLKRRAWRLSIVTFLSLLLGTLVGVPMAAVMYLGFGTAIETATTLVDTRSSMIRAQLVGRTRNFLNPAEQVPTFLGRVIDAGAIDPNDKAAIGEAIRYAAAAAAQLSTIGYASADGWVEHVSAAPDGVPEVLDDDWRDDPVTRAAMNEAAGQGARPHWMPPLFIEELEQTVLSFTRPILREGVFQGATFASIRRQTLDAFLKEMAQNMGATVYLLADRQYVLASSNGMGPFQATALRPLPVLDEVGDPVLASMWREDAWVRPLPTGAGEGRLVHVARRDYAMMFEPLQMGGNGNWAVVAYFNAASAVGEVRRLWIAVAVGVATLLAALALAMWLGRRLSRPVVALAKEAQAVERFDVEGLGRLPRSRLVEVDEANRAFNSMVGALRLFVRYVPRRLVERILSRGEDAVLRSRQLEGTILFTDIVNFTGRAEHMTAVETVSFLNEHMTLLTRCIEAEEGLVDKFIGDAVMAFWVAGTNHGSDDHAPRAVRAALSIQEAVAADNRDREEPVRLRIGIHTGEIVVGNIGAPSRMNFTIVGSAVNLAQRLESAGKLVGPHDDVCILMSAATAKLLPPEIAVRSVGCHDLPGVAEPVQLYTPGCDGGGDLRGSQDGPVVLP